MVTAKVQMSHWGFPKEVAFTAIFILSDKSSFTNGASILVDGGYTAK